jgi:hypothetical protein
VTLGRHNTQPVTDQGDPAGAFRAETSFDRADAIAGGIEPIDRVEAAAKGNAVCEAAGG